MELKIVVGMFSTASENGFFLILVLHQTKGVVATVNDSKLLILACFKPIGSGGGGKGLLATKVVGIDAFAHINHSLGNDTFNHEHARGVIVQPLPVGFVTNNAENVGSYFVTGQGARPNMEVSKGLESGGSSGSTLHSLTEESEVFRFDQKLEHFNNDIGLDGPKSILHIIRVRTVTDVISFESPRHYQLLFDRRFPSSAFGIGKLIRGQGSRSRLVKHLFEESFAKGVKGMDGALFVVRDDITLDFFGDRESFAAVPLQRSNLGVPH